MIEYTEPADHKSIVFRPLPPLPPSTTVPLHLLHLPCYLLNQRYCVLMVVVMENVCCNREKCTAVISIFMGNKITNKATTTTTEKLTKAIRI